MPFNISPSSYVGPQLMMQGASSVGQGIAQMMENLHKARQDQAADDVLFGYAKQQGMIDPETEHKYLTGNSTTKNGIIAGVARKFAMDMQQQQLNALKDQREAQAELRRQQTAAFDFAPDEANRKLARATGNELIQTGPGKFQLAPYGGADGSTWNPSGKAVFVTDPSGSVVGRQIQTGPNQSTFLPGTGNLEVKQDPKTKALFYREGKVWKPLSAQAIQAADYIPQDAATPAPAAASPMAGIVSKIQNALVGTGLAQRPAAAAAATPTPPVPTPTDTGAEPVVPAVPAQTPAPSAQDQANAIKAQFKAGQISREDAIKALRALGFQ